jgi:hypothetical protein
MQMRRPGLLLTAALFLAACGTFASTPAPASPLAEGFALRAWTTQALPPTDAFQSAAPNMAISDGRYISPGPQIEIFPAPLLPNVQERPLSGAGIEAVVAEARNAGLLDGPTDLTDGSLPGSEAAHISFIIEGREREVVGDASRQIVCVTTPCEPSPGTPEAFAGFWARLMDLPSWLGAELGPESPFAFTRLAILLTEPMLDATIPPSYGPWPLERPMLEFGVAVGDPLPRCGVVDGVEMDALLAAFRRANSQTRWTDDTGAELGIVARPLFPDEPDPCGVD